MPDIIKKITQKFETGKNALLMVVGDSITWGENHCTSEETYCAYLARHFAEYFSNITVLRYDGIFQGGAMPLKGYSGPVTVQRCGGKILTVVRCGVGGDTVRRALNRSEDYTGSFITGEKPDAFFAMFGINDALSCDKSKFISADGFYSNLKAFCKLINTTNPEAELCLMTPTFNDSGKSNKSCLDPYSQKVKQLAGENGLQCIDTHELWMNHLVVGGEHYGQGNWLSDVEGDSCHFAPEGSRATAEYIFKNIIGERV